MSDLIEVIKKVALNAVEASKPTNALFGVVVSDSPLKISIDQKMTLDSDSLVLTNAVKEHTLEMTVGEKVILLRMQGGQKYIVWDKYT